MESGLVSSFDCSSLGAQSGNSGQLGVGLAGVEGLLCRIKGEAKVPSGKKEGHIFRGMV